MEQKISGVVKRVISDTLLEVQVSRNDSGVLGNFFDYRADKSIRIKMNQSIYENEDSIDRAVFLLDREITCFVKERDERGCFIVDSLHFNSV